MKEKSTSVFLSDAEKEQLHQTVMEGVDWLYGSWEEEFSRDCVKDCGSCGLAIQEDEMPQEVCRDGVLYEWVTKVTVSCDKLETGECKNPTVLERLVDEIQDYAKIDT